MRAVFVDAGDALADICEAQARAGDPAVAIHRDPDIKPERVPSLIGDAEIVIIDHTYLPTDIARQCKGLKHVVFMGTGARSYMNIEELAELGIEVHLIRGYGDTAVAECAIALMWAGARGLSQMDRGIRGGRWLREEAMQLTGKTLGLVGFGGIAAEDGADRAWQRHEGDRLESDAEDFSRRRFRRPRRSAGAQRRGVDASAAQRRDPRHPFARENRAHQARRDSASTPRAARWSMKPR